MSSLLPFYDAGLVRQVATNLFYGWGYNFYRLENQLRADDQLIRAKAVWLLGLSAKSVESAEAEYRREFLPAPTRARPFPDSTAVGNAQRLERLHRSILALESRLVSLPVPENDRMTQRFRQEAPTLQLLISTDEQLIGQADLFRTMIAANSGAWLLENMASVDQGLDAISATVTRRESVLLGRVG